MREVSGPASTQVDADVRRLLGPGGVLVPGAEVPAELTPDALAELHREMVAQRALDEVMGELRRAGLVPGYPSATGHEAAIFGAGWALNSQDWVFPALREHGIARLRGAALDDLVAQCFGNVLDRSRGRAVPGHVGAPGQQLASISTPLATQLVHAAGAALGMRSARSNAVAVAFLGTAATCQGDFHAACHLARRERLPVVFMCIRNVGATGAPLAERSRARTVADRARAYGIPAIRVDGADVVACYAAAREAVDRARAGDGPGFIEALAWRLEDVAAVTEAWRAWDPIARLEAWGLDAGWLDADGIAAARAAARAEVEDVVAIMKVQDRPAAASLFDDVFAERTWALEEQAARAAG